MNITITIQSSEAKLELGNVQKKLSDLRPFFINFQAYMQSVTVNTFRRLRKSGRFRGINWPWFAPLYTRKDGTVVPAEGGIDKIRGEGRVKGRKRASGKRITSSSNLLRDTGRLQADALSRIKRTKQMLVMDTPEKYAGWQNQIRPFQFFEIPKDQNVAKDLFKKFLN